MYRINDEKVFFDIADGLAVVINTTTGMYYGMGYLGSAILNSLSEGVAPVKIAAKVKEQDGCPEDFDQKLNSFIEELVSKEILVPAEDSGDDPIFAPDVYSEGFDLSLDEFAEVKDLLLADPIHDVDAEMGWPVLDNRN